MIHFVCRKKMQKWWKRASYASSSSCLVFLIEKGKIFNRTGTGRVYDMSVRRESVSASRPQGARTHVLLWRVREQKSECEINSGFRKLAQPSV